MLYFPAHAAAPQHIGDDNRCSEVNQAAGFPPDSVTCFLVAAISRNVDLAPCALAIGVWPGVRKRAQERINLATAARVLATLNAFFSSDSPALSASHVRAPPPELVLFHQQKQQQQGENGQQEGEDGRQEQRDADPRADGGEYDSDSDSSEDDHDARGGGGGGDGGSRPPPGISSLPASAPAAPTSGGAPTTVPPAAPPRKRSNRRAAAPVEDGTILEWAAMAWAEMQSVGPGGGQGGGGGGAWAGGWDGGGPPAVSLGMTHAGTLFRDGVEEAFSDGRWPLWEEDILCAAASTACLDDPLSRVEF